MQITFTLTDTEVTVAIAHREVTLGHITDVPTEVHQPQIFKYLSLPMGHTT